MQLRNHPCMVCRGVSTWPPVWTPIGGGGGDQPDNETSVLEEVHPSLVEKKVCFVIVQCSDSRYIGTLQFHDEKCRENICDFLLRYRKETIARIGELEVDVPECDA